jgi:hypothetical protein
MGYGIPNFAKAAGLVSIKEIDEAHIIITPNPTNGEFKVSSLKFKVTGIEVFDIFGRTVGTNRCVRPETTIDISHLPSGIYFIRIQTETGTVTKKIVKQ